MWNQKAAIMLLVGLVIVIIAFTAVAQSPDDVTYKGADACKKCHSLTHEAIVKQYDGSGHAKAAVDIVKDPKFLLAQLDEESPMTKEQIAWSLAGHANYQAYLDKDMRVMSYQWDISKRKFTPIQAVDGSTQCIGCHVTGYDTRTKKYIHTGVGCEMCHGPGSAHNDTGDKAKILNPASLPMDKQAMICGQCHSKGTDLTKTYAFPTNFRPGQDLAKSFIDAKPTTSGQNQQYSEMLGGKHLQSGVVCTTCHDPHGSSSPGLKSQLRKPVNDLCIGCHADQKMDIHVPGAPEGMTCSACHLPLGSHRFTVPEE